MKNPRGLTEIMVEQLEPPVFKDNIKMYMKEPEIKNRCKGKPVETNKLIETELTGFMRMNHDAVKAARTKKDGGKNKDRKKEESKEKPSAPKGAGVPNQGFACLKCGSMEHTVRKCPQLTSDDEAEQLIQAARDKRKGQSYQRRVLIMKDPEETRKDSEKPRRDAGRVPTWVDGVEVDDVLLDSGADDSLVSRGLVEKIKKAGVFVREATPKKPTTAYPVGNKRFDLIKKVKFEVVRLAKSQGPLVVRDLEFWVHEENKDIDLTIGRPVMIRMGYTTDGLLTAARAARIEKGECLEVNEALSAGKKEMVDSPIL
jgi:hypothetical protein